MYICMYMLRTCVHNWLILWVMCWAKGNYSCSDYSRTKISAPAQHITRGVAGFSKILGEFTKHSLGV